MNNEKEKIQNRLKDDPSMRELRNWAAVTKKMMPVIRRWPENSKYKLDEGLKAFMSKIDALLSEADNFEKQTGKPADLQDPQTS